MFKSIPPITRNLLLINLLAFVAYIVLARRSFDINAAFGLHFFLASDFRAFQLITYMFLHANIEHIFFNMFALWMFGCVMERVWGGRRFVSYYLLCGLGAGLCQELAQFAQIYIDSNQGPHTTTAWQLLTQLSDAERMMLNGLNTVGASGAVYAILLAFGMTFPEERIFIFPLPIPIKAKWFVSFYIVVELFSALATSHSGVAHFAHLGGMLFGFLLIRYWKHHPHQSLFDDDPRRNSLLDRMQRSWEQHSARRQTNRTDADLRKTPAPQHPHHDTDAPAGQRKPVSEGEREIDRILDKIKESGYDSLTTKEKRYLFDAGTRQNRQ